MSSESEISLSSPVPRPVLAIGAAVAWLGILIQFGVSNAAFAARGAGVIATVWAMLGYFTILTNLLVATYYSALLLRPRSRLGRWFSRPATASAIAMYVTLVAVVVYLILRPIMSLSGTALLADNILHHVTPLLFLLVWAVWIPKRTLRWWHVPLWALYPIG